jgi:hypothetical protein
MKIKDILNESVVKDYYMEDWKTQTGLPADIIERYAMLGEKQRGRPESIMVKAQFILGGGVLNVAIEHAGDLTNRMSPQHGLDWGYDATLEKTEKVLSYLTSGYGFRREFNENMNETAKYDQIDLDVQLTNVKNILKQYAIEHSGLPVYNDIQTLARDAAVALGETKFEHAAELLKSLYSKIDTKGKYIKELRNYFK